MSVETAGLIFKVQAQDVEKTINLLSTLENIVDKLTVVTNGLESSFKTFNNATKGVSDTTRKLSNENKNLSSSFQSSASNVNNLSKGMMNANKASTELNNTTTGLSGALDRLGNKSLATANKLNKSVDRYKDITNNFNTSNIAAQIFDVGVTAGMGMNPFIIGIQQGTQLAQVFMNLEDPLEALAAGFKKILSPMTAFTIGLVALVAAGIEFVDWTSVAQSSLNGIANVFDFVGEHIGVLTGVLVAGTSAWIAYNGAAIKSTVITGINNLVNSFTSLDGIGNKVVKTIGKFFSTLLKFPVKHPIITAVMALGSALGYLADKFGWLDGVKAKFKDWSDSIRNYLDDNTKDLKKFSEEWTEVMKNYARGTRDLDVETLYMGSDLYTQTYWKEFNKLMDKVEDMKPKDQSVNDYLMSKWGETNRTVLETIIAEAEARAKSTVANKEHRDAIEANTKALEEQANALKQVQDIMEDSEDRLEGLIVKTAALGKDTYTKTYMEELYRQQTKLIEPLEKLGKTLEDLNEKGITYRQQTEEAARAFANQTVIYENTKKAIDEQAKAQRELNKELERQEKLAEQAAEAWDKLVKQYERYTTGGMDLPIFADDMTRNKAEFQKQYLSALGFDTLEDFKDSKFYTDQQKEEFDRMVEGAARYKTELDQLNGTLKFAKDTTQDFFSTMQQDLRQGMSLWKAFGDAVVNVLNKILDKMLSVGVDQLFSGLQMAGYLPGGKGINTSSLFSSTAGVSSSGNSIMLGAEYAKGGAFTNSVVSNPTLFKFAKGSRFGVMGEAGPEAVMPLTRGPDGNLGVRSVGGNADSAPVTVNVINNANAQASVQQRQTSQGVELDVMIDQVVAAKMAQPGTASNTSLKSVANRRLIMR